MIEKSTGTDWRNSVDWPYDSPCTCRQTTLPKVVILTKNLCMLKARGTTLKQYSERFD
ncbi:MAG: hypothetical protein GX905_08565 [Bacteroidales bacterium]|nr:hypothetical protein [Bacteroidales bacterium]